MKRKRLAALLMSVVMSTAILTGCGGSKDADNSTGEFGEKDSITVSMDGNATTLCPMESNTANNQMLGNLVLSSITDFDDDWNVIPNVAASWEFLTMV